MPRPPAPKSDTPDISVVQVMEHLDGHPRTVTQMMAEMIGSEHAPPSYGELMRTLDRGVKTGHIQHVRQERLDMYFVDDESDANFEAEKAPSAHHPQSEA